MYYECQSPILFLVFSRLSSTKLVFSSIKKVRPKKLYIAADGPRKDKIGESAKVAEVRNFILSSIDWECSIKTLFREQNLGCKNAIAGAIEWFFNNEGEGIILEDDVMPSNTFFYFCDQNLNFHRNNKKIGIIAGANTIDKNSEINEDFSYSFSKHSLIWGWATWKDRIKGYDVSLRNFNFNKMIFLISKNSQYSLSFILYWLNFYLRAKTRDIDTWDYQISLMFFYKQKINIIPKNNMIKNIGFNAEGTHLYETDAEKYQHMFPKEIEGLLIHNSRLEKDLNLDKKLDESYLPSPIKIFKLYANFLKNIIF